MGTHSEEIIELNVTDFPIMRDWQFVYPVGKILLPTEYLKKYRMDKFREAKALILVAEFGSLANSAIQENVTPAVISRRLDSLERRLGVKLLHRSTRSIKFTDVGISFLEDCHRLTKEWDLVEDGVSLGPREVSGYLNVTAPAAFGRIHIAPHAASFLKQHPKIKLSFNFADKVLGFVQEGYYLSIRIGANINSNVPSKVKEFISHLKKIYAVQIPPPIA